MITSGLLRALQNRSIRKIVNLEYTDRKSMVSDFLLGREFIEGDTPMFNVKNSKVLNANIKPAEMHWGKERIAEQYGYKMKLAPHSFKVFNIKR